MFEETITILGSLPQSIHPVQQRSPYTKLSYMTKNNDLRMKILQNLCVG